MGGEKSKRPKESGKFVVFEACEGGWGVVEGVVVEEHLRCVRRKS